MTEVILTCVAAAQVNPSSNGDEACKSCSTNEDECEVHSLTPRGGTGTCHVGRLIGRAVLLDCV